MHSPFYHILQVVVLIIYIYIIFMHVQVLVTSHLGRPKGGYEAKFSLAPVAPRLAQLLGVSVPLVPDCIGMAVSKHVLSMKVSVCICYVKFVLSVVYMQLKCICIVVFPFIFKSFSIHTLCTLYNNSLIYTPYTPLILYIISYIGRRHRSARECTLLPRRGEERPGVCTGFG